MKNLVYKSYSEEETSLLGQKLAPLLFRGAFLALYGGLGAGKTALTRSVAEGLGISDIMSPTFTIVREHKANGLKLFHFDAYRLGGEDELYCIGFEDYLRQNGVVVMEWCENVPGALPSERLEIRIIGSGQEMRELLFTAHGARYEALLEALNA